MNKKRLCCFYVNDIHLIMMLLPYINERINKSTKIITILERDISESVRKVIKGIQGKKSENLLKINWKNTSLRYLYEADVKDKLILISGNDEFMEKANQIVMNKKEDCTIINCYEMFQGSDKLQEILDEHDKVLNTSGEKDPEEVFTRYTKKDHKKITL